LRDKAFSRFDSVDNGLGGGVEQWYVDGCINEYSTSSPVSTEMGDRFVTRVYRFRMYSSHSGQLSFLPSAGWEMSSSQSAAKHCGWEVKAGMARSFHL